MDSAYLKIECVTKTFPGTIALDNVSFELKHKEILAVLGENGAGKSTLMKILSGRYTSQDYAGRIVLSGKELSFNSTKDAEAVGIVMIYQEKNLMLDLSIAENILMGHLPRKKNGLIDWKKTKKIAKYELSRLGIDNLDPSMNVRYLNASEQQLVCIARALVKKPKILILDEPTSCLTNAEAKFLTSIIKNLKETGISCIYISHKLDEAVNLCDRIVILRDGKYITEYKKEDFNPDLIIEGIVGRKLDVVFPKVHKTIGEEVFRCEHLKIAHPYAYGENIIEDVGFKLRKGEIVGLAGLVGSGRSELLMSIFGAAPMIKGEIFINGKKVKIKNPAAAKAYGMGFLTEDRKANGYIGCLSILKNMAITIQKLVSRYSFINEKKERGIVKNMFDRLKIKAPSLETNILNLSGGNQQKVLIGKWLLTELQIMFLDEPTRGVDVGTKAEVYKKICDLAAQGTSIIMVSSELPELLGLCDRFLILSKGKIVKELSREEATENVILKLASGL